jgi:hypothetical protein
MFYPIKGGTKIKLAHPNDFYDIWLPPVPEKSQIIGYTLPKEEQFWKRQPLPHNFEERYQEEKYKRDQELELVRNGDKEAITHVDPVLERYRRQEYLRRKWGVWFMNDGTPTYITGHHYWYLQYCKADHRGNDGYPFYYEFSRDAFYFRQWCEENPFSLGYLIVGPRGTGKSQEELACITNNATRSKDSKIALQSKSFEHDAQPILFQGKLVQIFNNLPEMFKPVYAHGTSPVDTMMFKRASKRGKEAANIKFGKELELNTFIYAVRPGEKVLDGQTMSEIFEDEVGKVNPKEVADVYKRHEVNRKVVFRNHRKVGMMRKTTTVEEMKEGGAECHELWKDSDPRNVGKNGWTVSQIHRYFISANTTDTSPEVCDKYGRVDKQKANEKIENTLTLIRHDLQKLSSELRKNPRNETEAFIIDQSKSVFNTMLLTKRLNQIRNEMSKPPYIRGNFYWLKEKFQKVWFERDDYSGRFNIHYLPDEFSQIKEPDKAKIINNVAEAWGWDLKGKSRRMLTPMNDHLFRIGTDPIKFSKTKDPRASKAAAHGFRLYDALIDYGKPKEQWQSHNFMFEYVNRPEDPETYFEDMAMACIFYGCKILPERNVPSLNQYFELNGLEKFLAYPKQFIESGLVIQTQSDDAGYASSPEVIDYYTRRLITYINQHIMRCPFDNTIEDWLNFDSTNPTKFDATVSSGFTLVHAEKIAENPNDQPEETLDDWFERADNSGTVGTFVETQIERYGT